MGIAFAALVGGILIGLLTGYLIGRKRSKKSSNTASGDPGASSQVVYEEVHPPKPATGIPMQENISYGPL